MKRACIDTHALVWHASKPKRLGRRALRLLREADLGRAQVLVPAIVAVELSLIREAGRRVIGPAELRALLSAQPAFCVLPLDLEQTVEFALLSSIADPFDRLVIAAARSAGVPLITADETIASSGLVPTLWD
ncbi:MAG: PIN domain-containing protein [Deltaproteobacteria bacterium]|nr:PIN domain-containing protein [Deltaproteobacteria bacterium]